MGSWARVFLPIRYQALSGFPDLWDTEKAAANRLAVGHAQSSDQVILRSGVEAVVANGNVVEVVVVVGCSRVQGGCEGGQLALAKSNTSSINVSDQTGGYRRRNAGASDS